ncbi:SYF2 splicing factor-domain-containing protein [Mycena sp. CBHHK59/15]|nr:SYF2 splicing factor-domain-containing protein [Mycena sp. CBHHK59/15]
MTGVVEPSAPTLTMEERKAKMDQLRQKRAASHKANRASLVEESAKAQISRRRGARRPDAVERAKNWEWTIEENDYWEKKKARKARRADFEFHDDAHAARRRYKKDLDQIKPDLAVYNRQKELAMGLAPGTLTAFNPTASSSQPSEDAIDRMVGKINREYVPCASLFAPADLRPTSIDKKGKFSRKRVNEDEGDITYINEHNRVFNKKIARYYDKYTAEIRASFERGTAL